MSPVTYRAGAYLDVCRLVGVIRKLMRPNRVSTAPAFLVAPELVHYLPCRGVGTAGTIFLGHNTPGQLLYTPLCRGVPNLNK